MDILATGTIVFAVLAAVFYNFLLGVLAGFFLALTAVCAHNFFHMRDNWRMYLFNMSLLTVRHWRISHALSHHSFPNTLLDYEISMFEPFMEFLPTSDKPKWFTDMSAVLSPLLYPFFSFAEASKRTLTTLPHAQDLVCLLLPILMMMVGRVPVLDALSMWSFIIMVNSVFFAIIGLNAAHHHPDIFHHGDMPREDRDWGLYTLDATRDRVEIYGSPNLVLVTFGDHTLHHFFPTVDHVHLHALYPILEQTCKEFGIDYQQRTTWDLIFGQFRQLMRTEPNLKERNYY